MLSPWYITGFCEGEATFTYSRSGKNLGLYFAIKLNAEDKDLIEQIRDFFGVGQIYKVKPRLPRAYSGNTSAAVYYRITRISHLERVVQHFDEYPLVGNKLAAYQIWKKMFLIKKKFRNPNILKLLKLALALSDLSAKNTATKPKLQNAISSYNVINSI